MRKQLLRARIVGLAILLAVPGLVGCRAEDDGAGPPAIRFDYAPAMATISALQDGVWQVRERLVLTYGEGRRLSSLLYQRLENGAFVDREKREYAYDATGLLESESLTAFTTKNGIVPSRRDYHYDGRRLAKEEFWFPEETELKRSSRDSYSYDPAGRLRESSLAGYEGDTLRDASSWTDYTYDEKGRVTLATPWTSNSACVLPDGTLCPPLEQQKRSYTYEGNRLVAITTLDGDQPVRRSLFESDGALLTAERRQEHVDGAWQDERRQTIVRDGDDLTITSARFDGSQWQERERLEVVMTRDGNSAFVQGPWHPKPMSPSEVYFLYGAAPFNPYEK
jgi:hypothetical protein